jgi:hypothetical protein
MTNERLSVPWFDLKSIFNVTSFITVAKAGVPGLGSFQPTLTTVVFLTEWALPHVLLVGPMK